MNHAEFVGRKEMRPIDMSLNISDSCWASIARSNQRSMVSTEALEIERVISAKALGQ